MHHDVDYPTTAEDLVGQLERAGRTLLALPNSGPSTRLVQGGLEWIRDVSESYGRSAAKLRPAVPDAATISHMDTVLAWIPLIPVDKYVLRRIVGARCLVNPMTDRHVFSWRRLGVAIGADHKAVQRWHVQGVHLILGALQRRRTDGEGRWNGPALGPHRHPSLPQPPRHHRGAHG